MVQGRNGVPLHLRLPGQTPKHHGNLDVARQRAGQREHLTGVTGPRTIVASRIDVADRKPPWLSHGLFGW